MLNIIEQVKFLGASAELVVNITTVNVDFICEPLPPMSELDLSTDLRHFTILGTLAFRALCASGAFCSLGHFAVQVTLPFNLRFKV